MSTTIAFESTIGATKTTDSSIVIATSIKNELKTQSVDGEEVNQWRRGRHWPLPSSIVTYAVASLIVKYDFGNIFGIRESVSKNFERGLHLLFDKIRIQVHELPSN